MGGGLSNLAGQMAPEKKGNKRMNCSAIDKVMTKEYTINIHKCIHGLGIKKRAPKRELGICLEGDGTPDGPTDTRLNKVVCAKGIGMLPLTSMCACPGSIMRLKIH
jgi:large subunit ribosomal protein L31e